MRISTDQATSVLGIFNALAIMILAHLGILPIKLEAAAAIAASVLTGGVLTNHKDIEVLVDKEKEILKDVVSEQEQIVANAMQEKDSLLKEIERLKSLL